MWQSVGKTKYRTIWIEDNVIKAKDPYEPLYPFDKPDLPNEFAKITDIKSALRFEHIYAPLNHDSLVFNIKERKGGDPIEWVLDHARFVKFALDLMYALAIDDGGGAFRLFRKFVSPKDYSHQALQGTGDFEYPYGAVIDTTIVPAPKFNSDALRGIPHIIALLVNANTKNIHQELMITLKGRIMSVQRYNALIEAIWSMVGDLAMKAQQEIESGSFKKCEWCGSPFWATHKGRKYCPPIHGKESHCGLISRQRKFQAKKNR